jgi:hypothetical protein
LPYKILDKPPNGIVCERRYYSPALTETVRQVSPDVILTAAFPYAKVACSLNSIVARIKTKKNFA